MGVETGKIQIPNSFNLCLSFAVFTPQDDIYYKYVRRDKPKSVVTPS